MNVVLIVKNNVLENLKRKIESAPGIVRVKEGNQCRAVKTQRVPEGIFLYDSVGMVRVSAGSETERAGIVGDVIGFFRKVSLLSPNRCVERNVPDIACRIIKLTGKDICTIID